MSATVILGLIAATLEVAALITRFVETRRAKSVEGLAPTFLWFSIILNVAWAAYGWRVSSAALMYPSMLAVAVFAYALWRVHTSGRPQWKPLPLYLLASAALVAVAYLSPNGIGTIGGILAIGSCIPQAWRVWRTHNIDGIAPVAWLITFAFCSVWAAYGFAAALVPVWVTNIVVASLALVVLAGYARARRMSQP